MQPIQYVTLDQMDNGHLYRVQLACRAWKIDDDPQALHECALSFCVPQYDQADGEARGEWETIHGVVRFTVQPQRYGL